jgi:hypothetical protein
MVEGILLEGCGGDVRDRTLLLILIVVSLSD